MQSIGDQVVAKLTTIFNRFNSLRGSIAQEVYEALNLLITLIMVLPLSDVFTLLAQTLYKVTRPLPAKYSEQIFQALYAKILATPSYTIEESEWNIIWAITPNVKWLAIFERLSLEAKEKAGSDLLRLLKVTGDRPLALLNRRTIVALGIAASESVNDVYLAFIDSRLKASQTTWDRNRWRFAKAVVTRSVQPLLNHMSLAQLLTVIADEYEEMLRVPEFQLSKWVERAAAILRTFYETTYKGKHYLDDAVMAYAEGAHTVRMLPRLIREWLLNESYIVHCMTYSADVIDVALDHYNLVADPVAFGERYLTWLCEQIATLEGKRVIAERIGWHDDHVDLQKMQKVLRPIEVFKTFHEKEAVNICNVCDIQVADIGPSILIGMLCQLIKYGGL